MATSPETQVAPPAEGEKAPVAPVAGTGQPKESESLRGDIARLVHQFQSFVGGAKRDRELTVAVAQEVATLGADPNVLTQKIAAIQAAEAAEQAQARTAAIVEEYLVDINAEIAEVGMKNDDPRLQRAAELWQEAAGENDPQKMFAVTKEVRAVVKRARAEAHKAELARAQQEVVETRQRYNRESGTLDTGVREGMPAGGGIDWGTAQRAKNLGEISDADYARLIAQR